MPYDRGWLDFMLGKRERPTLVCQRLNETRIHHAREIVRRCGKCGESVAIYPSGQRVLKRYGERVDLVCNRCADFVNAATRGETVAAAPGAIEEARDAIAAKKKRPF